MMYEETISQLVADYAEYEGYEGIRFEPAQFTAGNQEVIVTDFSYPQATHHENHGSAYQQMIIVTTGKAVVIWTGMSDALQSIRVPTGEDITVIKGFGPFRSYAKARATKYGQRIL